MPMTYVPETGTRFWNQSKCTYTVDVIYTAIKWRKEMKTWRHWTRDGHGL